MVPSHLMTAYHWNYRPQIPRRPEWFKEWPGGNRIAVTINVMHEWESRPRSNTARKGSMTDAGYLDFLGLSMRQYGANFGFSRLLDVFDRCGVTATVITSGLMAELFPESLREARERGHEVATAGPPLPSISVPFSIATTPLCANTSAAAKGAMASQLARRKPLF